MSTLSPLLLLLLSFGFAGDPVLQSVLGLEGALLLETRELLRILAVYVASVYLILSRTGRESGGNCDGCFR
ncbi:hypothetical protein J2T18_003520 [Paenibacillus polymyxa]|nr:hypothetical protein [Paenibacillus polymyxa]